MVVKTAISVPDHILEQVNRKARDLGLNRSQFFSQAAERYLREIDDDITERINAALDAAGDDDSNAVAAAHGRRMLLELTADDEW
ncbi:DNA-binding protein, CopG family, putative Antitoxin protein ChpI [Blastococcus saxobsidens DD2]|uniref:DNA-binding protein, CopG family, putative Antitoxin protein ChpI n=1 Tax=Blastococcus saxobsidens (strain DD2) TaxID=1146883 RepID=H6RM56_BLASD|nr:DNA-binding protein, CopG family, putative Antitoxin protein ChpI [Blastococcus saxobsidens DD2]